MTTARPEVPLKVWVIEEAKRAHVHPGAIHNRIARGRYPGLQFRRVNQRIVYVLADSDITYCPGGYCTVDAAQVLHRLELHLKLLRDTLEQISLLPRDSIQRRLAKSCLELHDTLLQEIMNTESLSPPRWTNGPSQCVKANLPSFESEAALKQFMASDCPRCSITFIWKCSHCEGYHCHADAPNPSGDSSGTGRNRK